MDKQLLIDLAIWLVVTIGALVIVSLPSRQGKRK